MIIHNRSSNNLSEVGDRGPRGEVDALRTRATDKSVLVARREGLVWYGIVEYSIVWYSVL